jgi:hypothetical protein
LEGREDNIGVVIDYCVGKIIDSTINHIECSVSLTGWCTDTRNSHGVVTSSKLGWVSERKNDQIVDIIQTIKRIQYSAILSGYFDS